MHIHKARIFLQNFHKTPCGCLITIRNLNADYTGACQDDHVCLESSPGLPVSLDCLLCWFNCKLCGVGCVFMPLNSQSQRTWPELTGPVVGGTIRTFWRSEEGSPWTENISKIAFRSARFCFSCLLL